ncbi:MAG: xanthine dehydrogenase family protein molybdopterin-binding subunit [Spirochaetaceae bacterium]|nr:xanthine dehydrogenase family protein molybdopterin-binding subunit [Spirochaetaceae bacterium]
MSAPYRYLGRPRPLIDGRAKALGATRYAADVELAGMLHAQPVLSTEAHARLRAVHAEEARSVPGVVAVLTAADLPVTAEPPTIRQEVVLAREMVTFAGQPVALVVGESAAAAADGAALVEVDYEPLPPVVGVSAATQGGPPSEDGEYVRGDVRAALEASAHVVKRTCRTPFVHQGYLEPTAAVAAPDPYLTPGVSGANLTPGVTVYSGCQGQFDVRTRLASILELPAAAVRVVPMAVGGGFGGKGGVIDPLAAAAALRLNRPVKLVLDRSTDLATTTPTPAMSIELELGADRHGEITALRVDITLDNGAFPNGMGGGIAKRMAGCYRIPHLSIHWRDVCTNVHATGAYRAPGAPQTTFVLETAVDALAAALEVDPLEFRKRNVVRAGDPQPDGTPWPAGGQLACLEAVESHPLWRSRHEAGAGGTGLAIAGWIPLVDPCAAACRVDPDGTVVVTMGAVDISGVYSSLVLVAAEEIGVDPRQVRVQIADSASAPYGPSAGGSNIACSAADAVRTAAADARRQFLALAADHFEAAVEDLEIADGAVRVAGVPDRTISVGALAHAAQSAESSLPHRRGPIQASGQAAGPGGAAVLIAHVVRVAVDRETRRVRPTDNQSVQDVGLAMNPLLVEGQLHGGAAQGLGIGLHEALRHDDAGQLLTGTLMDYGMPRATSVPPITTHLLQRPSHGPYGALGVGEPPIVAGAAAAANAVTAATGAQPASLPLDPESVWAETVRRAAGPPGSTRSTG